MRDGSQLLSQVGKATLIKAVAQAIPVYSMPTFKLPQGICSNLDALVRKLWRGSKRNSNRYLALKFWDAIYLPKESGGLEFRRFKDLNQALLAKLAWKIASNEESLWVAAFRSKYLSYGSFFDCEVKPGDFWVWKSILNARDIISKGACFKLEDGWSINP